MAYAKAVERQVQLKDGRTLDKFTTQTEEDIKYLRSQMKTRATAMEVAIVRQSTELCHKRIVNNTGDIDRLWVDNIRLKDTVSVLNGKVNGYGKATAVSFVITIGALLTLIFQNLNL